MKRNAFTLVELLVVITIIALLVGILLPMISNSKEAANLAKCGNNLSQIGKAALMYADDNKERLPNVYYQGITWDTLLLSYLAESKKVFACPSDPYPTASNRTYSANAAPTSGSGGSTNTWRYPFGRYTTDSSLRLGDMDFRKYQTGDIIFFGERPYDKGGNPGSDRGYVGAFSFCGMDAVAGWIHKKNTGGNYFMGSGAIRFFRVEEIPIVAGTNYWLSSDS